MSEPFVPQDSSNIADENADMKRVETHKPQSKKPSPKVLLGGLLGLVLLGGVLVAITQLTGESQNNTSDVSGIEVASIYITPEGFVPANLQIKPNTQVVWTNKDKVSHELSVSNKDAQLGDVLERLAPQEVFSIVLDEAGSYHYHSPESGTKFQGVITVNGKVAGDE